MSVQAMQMRGNKRQAKAVLVPLEEQSQNVSKIAVLHGLVDDTQETLNFSGGRIPPDDPFFAPIIFCLKATTSCVNVSLSHCSLDIEQFEAICQSLENNMSVINLNLSKNGLGPERAKAMTALIRKNKCIRSVDIREKTLIGVEGCKTIISALIRNQSLGFFNGVPVGALKFQNDWKVELAFEEVGLDEMFMIAQFCRGNSILEKIDLAHNNICGPPESDEDDEDEDGVKKKKKKKKKGGHYDDEEEKQVVVVKKKKLRSMQGLQFLLDSLQRAPLLELNLGHNKLRKEGVELLSGFFADSRNNQKLTALDLSNVQIEAPQMPELVEQLMGIDFLTELNLSSNWFGEGYIKPGKQRRHYLDNDGEVVYVTPKTNTVGSEAVTTVFGRDGPINLTSVNLSNNSVYDEGFIYMCGSLTTNISLTAFNASHNYISSEGAQEAAEAIKNNTVLAHLDLSHTRLGNEGIDGYIALASAFQYCQLTSLNLSNTRLCGKSADGLYGKHTIDALDALCSSASLGPLTCLNISGNWLCPEGLYVISEHVAQGAFAQLNLSNNYLTRMSAYTGKMETVWFGEYFYAGVDSLIVACKSERSKLVDVDLDDNGLQDDQKHRLREALTSKTKFAGQAGGGSKARLNDRRAGLSAMTDGMAEQYLYQIRDLIHTDPMPDDEELKDIFAELFDDDKAEPFGPLCTITFDGKDDPLGWSRIRQGGAGIHTHEDDASHMYRNRRQFEELQRQFEQSAQAFSAGKKNGQLFADVLCITDICTPEELAEATGSNAFNRAKGSSSDEEW
jgi:Ran GTPase-activating protein (RanGAP) involved in mRNA processing and transport